VWFQTPCAAPPCAGFHTAARGAKEARRTGIEHAKARDDIYRGRKPSFTRKQLDQVRDMLAIGTSISVIAKTTGLSLGALEAAATTHWLSAGSTGSGETDDAASHELANDLGHISVA